MNVDALATQFWEQGYIMLEEVFAEEFMDELNEVILDHFGFDPEYWHNEEFLSKSKVEVIPWFPQWDGVEAFNPANDHPLLQHLTAKIIGEKWEEHYCMIMFSKQGSRGQAWHQDCAPEDATRFNINRLIYTHDITPEIGGQTVVIPGTHKKGLIPAGSPTEDMAGQIVLEPKKGSLILLHGHTWHRVLPVKGRYRVSTNFRAAPKGIPRDITDVCVYRNMRYRFSTSEVIEERVAR